MKAEGSGVGVGVKAGVDVGVGVTVDVNGGVQVGTGVPGRQIGVQVGVGWVQTIRQAGGIQIKPPPEGGVGAPGSSTEGGVGVGA